MYQVEGALRPSTETLSHLTHPTMTNPTSHRRSHRAVRHLCTAAAFATWSLAARAGDPAAAAPAAAGSAPPRLSTLMGLTEGWQRDAQAARRRRDALFRLEFGLNPDTNDLFGGDAPAPVTAGGIPRPVALAAPGAQAASDDVPAALPAFALPADYAVSGFAPVAAASVSAAPAVFASSLAASAQVSLATAATAVAPDGSTPGSLATASTARAADLFTFSGGLGTLPASVGAATGSAGSSAHPSATVPTGPQPDAVLVPPANETTYYSRGRAVALSGGTALVASNTNASVLGSAVYLYGGVDTATGAVSPSAQLTSVDGQAGGAGDNFGYSMSLAGGLGLVGAPAFTNNSFLVYTYVYRNLDTASGTVTESARLRPSDATNLVGFGQSVSLAGTTGLVGAYQAKVDSTSSFVVGEAYLYRNLNTASGTINENVRLIPSDNAPGANATGGRFGWAVSLSGNTGLVGAYQAATNGNANQGAAYVFRNLDTASGSVTQNVKLTASDGAAQDYFGYAVSQSGNTALVGAYRATATSTTAFGPGAAYVFRNLDTASGTVTQNVKLVASDTVGGTTTTASAFGFSVALSGNTALVGAPGTVSSSSTGIINQGAAYLYRNLDTATGTVTQNVKLFASDGAVGDRFGYAISVDGDRFVIGAPQFQTSQAGKSYTGSLGSVSTLDLGNTSAIISGISFVSQDNWVVGQNTSGNQVTLSAGDTATVNATGKGVFIGQNAGSNNNRLIIAGTVNANTFTIGATGNTGNTLQLGNGGTTGSLPVGATIIDSGVLAFNRSNAVVQGTDFNGAALTGIGGVAQLGTGTTTLNAANTYTGPTTVNAGTLQAGSTSAFGNNSAVTLGNVSGATLALNGFNTQIGSLTGGGTAGGNVTLGSATLTVGGNNNSPAAYAGSISGTGGLTKLGTGTQTLAGANTYSGATNVNAGTLLFNGTNTGTGLVTVQNSGSMLGGTGTLAAAVSVTTGTLAPGNNAGAAGLAANVGRLTTGALTLSSMATSVFDLASGTTYDQAFANGNIVLGGTLTLNVSAPSNFTTGQVLDLFHANGTGTLLTGTFSNFANAGTYNYNGESFLATYTATDFTLTALGSVPEPATWAGGALLLGAAGWSLRRRLHRQGSGAVVA